MTVRPQAQGAKDGEVWWCVETSLGCRVSEGRHPGPCASYGAEGVPSKKAAARPRLQGQAGDAVLSGVSQTEKDRHLSRSHSHAEPEDAKVTNTGSRRMVAGLGVGAELETAEK